MTDLPDPPKRSRKPLAVALGIGLLIGVIFGAAGSSGGTTATVTASPQVKLIPITTAPAECMEAVNAMRSVAVAENGWISKLIAHPNDAATLIGITSQIKAETDKVNVAMAKAAICQKAS